MNGTIAKKTIASQVVHFCIPGSQQLVLQSLLEHRNTLWDCRYECNLTRLPSLETDPEWIQKYGMSATTNNELADALEELPKKVAKRLLKLFVTYKRAEHELSEHYEKQMYVKGIADGFTSYGSIVENITVAEQSMTVAK